MLRSVSLCREPKTATLKWKFLADSTIFSDPVIAADGSVYFGCDDHNVYALNASGTLRWKFPTGPRHHGLPGHRPGGTVYIGSVDNNLYAIHPNGTTNWVFTTAANVNSSAAVDPDGTIYFGSDDQNLYALNPNGTEKWHYTAGGAVRSSPALAADGTICFGADDGLVYAIDANGTFLWSFTTGDYVFASPVIAGDGTIYAASADHNVYALHGASGLSGSHWPMFRHDAKHTGKEVGSNNNTSPMLTHIGNKSVAEETLLTFTTTATDTDIPMQMLTFSLDAGFPTGASITPGGAFTWKPTEAQGPGSYDVTVRVSDNGSPAMSAAETITITVNEVNVAPTLATIPDQAIHQGMQLTVQIAGSDTDLPSNTLTYG